MSPANIFRVLSDLRHCHGVPSPETVEQALDILGRSVNSDVTDRIARGLDARSPDSLQVLEHLLMGCMRDTTVASRNNTPRLTPFTHIETPKSIEEKQNDIFGQIQTALYDEVWHTPRRHLNSIRNIVLFIDSKNVLVSKKPLPGYKRVVFNVSADGKKFIVISSESRSLWLSGTLIIGKEFPCIEDTQPIEFHEEGNVVHINPNRIEEIAKNNLRHFEILTLYLRRLIRPQIIGRKDGIFLNKPKPLVWTKMDRDGQILGFIYRDSTSAPINYLGFPASGEEWALNYRVYFKRKGMNLVVTPHHLEDGDNEPNQSQKLAMGLLVKNFEEMTRSGYQIHTNPRPKKSMVIRTKK